MKQAWEALSEGSRAAIEKASWHLRDADLRFVLMVFEGERGDGVGAVVSNIDPSQAVGLMEGAVRAARMNVEVVEIERGGTQCH